MREVSATAGRILHLPLPGQFDTDSGEVEQGRAEQHRTAAGQMVLIGWGGTHPVGVPVIVVTSRTVADWPHRDTFTFVGDVQVAVAAARDAAAGQDVVIASASIAQQALDAGLLDGIHVDLVPVLLGAGIRWFDNLAKAPLGLGTPVVAEGNGVTHLAYQVLTARG